jgi:hypothetical protein
MGLTGQQINYNLVRNYPTLLWFAPKGLQDVGMKAISLVGMALSATVVLVGGSNVLLQTSLWILYHSVRMPPSYFKDRATKKTACVLCSVFCVLCSVF